MATNPTTTAPVRTPLKPDDVSGGERTRSGGTYGDWVPDAVAHPGHDSLQDPSRGAELERDVHFSAQLTEGPAVASRAVASREERVRAAAYRLYVERGAVDGHALEDWLAAEAAIDPAPDSSPTPDIAA